jgi:hypothetical protein
VALVSVGPRLDLFVLGPDAAVSRAERPSPAEPWSAPQRIEKASPLDSEFSGKATLEIPSMSVKVSTDVKIGLRFSVNRKQVEIVSFPPVTTASFDTPLGRSTSTVSLAGSQEGTFDPSSGQLQLPVTLHFDQSLDLPFIDEDGNLALNLDSTGPGGSSLDRESGKIALGSSGSFDGSGTNPLDGAACQVLLTGTLSTLP